MRSQEWNLSNAPFFALNVLESNDEPISPSIDEYENLSVSIHHYEPEAPIAEKLLDGLKQLESYYVQICADDDFIDNSGISSCADFLDNHSDFSAAQGTCIHFRVERDADTGKPMFRESMQEHLHDIAFEAADQPLLWHMEHYRPTFYAIHRTVEIVEWFRRAWTAAPRDMPLEVMPSAATVIHEKVKS